jgi:cation diffusion facilitator CzcD-associated flavoprotein CzcO
VIGAGACGICAAKYLIEVGFDVTVFEIGSQIGGMWCYGNDSGRSSAHRLPAPRRARVWVSGTPVV